MLGSIRQYLAVLLGRTVLSAMLDCNSADNYANLREQESLKRDGTRLRINGLLMKGEKNY